MQNKPGYSAADLSGSPYAAFYNPDVKPVQAQVADALITGAQAHSLFPTADQAAMMAEPGYWPIETGYTRTPEGGINVFCLTHMPGVTPAMWNWWFGWHGCEALRYRLWHPKAHVSARWADGKADERYIGRTSLIREYLGADCIDGAVSFVTPSALGLDEDGLSARGEVAICTFLGKPGLPVKAGRMIHQLRPVEGGCEMRSRMWIGGRHVSVGSGDGALSRTLARLARPIVNRLLPDPAELLVHNAQEMAHLAGFLPDLYKAFGPQGDKS